MKWTWRVGALKFNEMTSSFLHISVIFQIVARSADSGDPAKDKNAGYEMTVHAKVCSYRSSHSHHIAVITT